MGRSDAYEYFFRIRWPYGFVCPRCGHSACYTISGRTSPLYQCRRCRLQTSLTAGTAMERSRAPLAAWAKAFRILSETRGLNAVQLAKRIGVSHKSAWTMLRRIREAISRVEAENKLRGRAQLGLMFLGTRNLQPFVPHPQEHAVLLGSTVDRFTGEPAALKLLAVPAERLVRKQLVRNEAPSLIEAIVHPEAEQALLHQRFAPTFYSPLRQCFQQATDWLNDLFRGLGRKYLQQYLDEYSFRFNVERSGKNLHQCLLSACFG